MTDTVESKVVEIRFDNSKFEKNISQSIASIEKLKESLKFDNVSKGFENIRSAEKACSLPTLSSSVEAVRSKFSALEVMAMTALSNITNSAVNAGKKIINSLTVEPISTGFNEYELKMGSIQTIMASTGESLDKVNQKLDELNTYSDRTIYSFSDMTQNIGKFTNAGVKLDDAVAAIQGVSNVAAVSGANANEASRAMYNFAQALSAGYIKLIDWKSIENANMATVEFKNYLLDAAVAAGTLEKTSDGMYKVLTTNANGATMKDTINATHYFNDSLSYQWMTTEVLTSTLKDYADETTAIGKKAFAAAQDVKTFSMLLDTLKEAAQSGWATTWQLFIGDYEEAKDTLAEYNTYFSDILSESADNRNELLQGTLMSSWGQLKKQVSDTGLSVDEFQESLKQVAIEGVDGFAEKLEKLEAQGKSFEDTFEDGWLTTDMITEALNRVAEASDGSIQFTEEQIKELKELYKQAYTASGAVGDLVSKIERKSGRELIFDSILNVCKALQKVFGAVKKAWEEVFPPATSEKLYGIIDAIHNFTENLIISDESAGLITTTFKGLFSVLGVVKEAISGVITVIKPLFGGIGSLGTAILEHTAAFGDWLSNLTSAVNEGNLFGDVANRIAEFVGNAKARVSEFIETVKEKFNFPGFDGFLTLITNAKLKVTGFIETVQQNFKFPGFEGLKSLLSWIHDKLVEVIGVAKTNIAFPGLEALKNVLIWIKDQGVAAFNAIGEFLSNLSFGDLLSGLSALANGIGNILGKVISTLGSLGLKLIETIGSMDFGGIIDLINSISFGALISGSTNFLDNITAPFKNLNAFIENFSGMVQSAKDVLGSISGAFGGLGELFSSAKDSLVEMQNSLKADILLKIAGAIAILAASLVLISTIDIDKLFTSTAAITDLFVNLMGSMALISKLGIGNLAKCGATMLALSTAVGVLSLSVKSLSSLDLEGLLKGIGGVTALVAGLTASMVVIGKFGGQMVSGAANVVLFAAGIQVLANACVTLSSLSLEQLGVGLLGVGALLAEIDVFLNTAKFSSKTLTTATGIVVLAAALKILVPVCKDFASMSLPDLAKGLGSIGALLAEVGVFTALAGKAKHVTTTGLALIEMGAAMKIFASAMGDFAGLNQDEIARGLIAMGGALAEVAVAMNVMPKSTVLISTGLVVLGGALEIIANVLSKMGGMSWEEIGKSLVVLGGSIAELAVGLNLMIVALPGAAAMLVAAAAIAAFVPSLKSMGSMGWDEIAKGLLTLAGTFATLGVAGALLGPLTPTILALSAAFVLFGAGTATIGAGLLLISAGIASLAASLGGGVAVIIAGWTSIITGIVAMIPIIIEKLGDCITAICEVIIGCVPTLAEAIKVLVLAVVDVLVECVPQIVDGLLVLIDSLLAALVKYVPTVIDSIMVILIELINGIAARLPELIQAAVNLVMSIFVGIVDALKGLDTSGLLDAIVGIGFISAMLIALGALSSMVPSAMQGVLGLGVLILELTAVLAAVGAIAQIPGLNWLIDEGGKLLGGIGSAIGSFIGGIVGGIAAGMTRNLPEVGTNLSGFMTNAQPFIDGISKVSPDMFNSVKAFADAIFTLTGADILNGLTSWFTGGDALANFGEQLVPFGNAIADFGDAVADVDGELVNKAATAAKTLAEMAESLPKSGGVVDFFTGENDMTGFADQLVIFGEGMARFYEKIRGVDPSVVEGASTAGKAMAEMAETLPNTGGVVGFFTGENDMSYFATQLVPFGQAMKDYSLAVAGLDVDAITNSSIAGKAMAELANSLPKCGGLLTFFTGSADIITFATKLVPFGRGIKGYADEIEGMDSEAVTNSATAGKALAELANTIPKCGGLVNFFTGESDLSAFGEKLVPFGKDLAAYSKAIVEVEPESVQASANAAKALSDLAAGLPNSSFVDEWFNGKQTLSSFGDQLASFGLKMSTYYANVEDIDPARMEAVTNQIAAIVELSKSIPNLKENFASVGELVTGIFSDIQKSIDNNQPDLLKAVEDVVKNVVTAIDNSMSKFKTLGQNAAQGFIDGLASKLSASSAAGAKLATAALEAAQNALDCHSPSLEFFNIGAFCGEGLALGFDQSIDDNADTIANGCAKFISKVRKGLSGIQEVAFGEATPEVDMAALPYKKQMLLSSARTTTSTKSSAADKAADDWINKLLSGNGTKETEEAANKQTSIVQNAAAAQTKAVKSAYEQFVEYIEEERFYNRITTEEQLKQYENVRKTYNLTADEIKKCDREIYTLRNQLVQESYQASIDWMDEEKFYNRLTTEEELNDYRILRERYADDAELRKKIDREIYTLENKLIEERYQASIDWMEQEKAYGKLSTEEELNDYRILRERYADDAELRKKIDKEIYDLENQLVQERYQAELDWMEEKKFYGQLTTEEELANYRRMQQEYAEGSEERKKIDREVYTLEKQLVQERYQAELDYIEEEKFYNRMGKVDELAAYKKMQKEYKKGSEERKKIDREVYTLEKDIYDAHKQYLADVQTAEADAAQQRLDLQEEYADKVEEINQRLADDIDALNDKYTSELESRSNSLYQSYGLFDEVKEHEEVSSETLLKNLEGQVKEFSKWTGMLDDLTAKGVSQGLIEELQEMGPSAIAQIEALNNMTSDQLDQYVNLWSIKHSQARFKATEELTELRSETDASIQQLQADADAELSEYQSTWQQRMDQINIDTDAKLQELRTDFETTVGLIKTNTEEEMEEMSATVQEILREAGWEDTGDQIVEDLATGMEENESFDEELENIETSASDSQEALLDNDWKGTGNEIVDQLAAGVQGNDSFIASLRKMAQDAIAAVKETLQINSPSKVLEGLGNNTVDGFVKGLDDYGNKASEAGTKVGDAVKEGLSETASSMSDVLQNGVKGPVITPIVDFDEYTMDEQVFDTYFGAANSTKLGRQASSMFEGTTEGSNVTVNVDTDSTVNELKSMRKDMSAMMKSISSMAVVLDSGTLVGEIAGDMDRELGRRQVSKKRGT